MTRVSEARFHAISASYDVLTLAQTPSHPWPWVTWCDISLYALWRASSVIAKTPSGPRTIGEKCVWFLALSSYSSSSFVVRLLLNTDLATEWMTRLSECLFIKYLPHANGLRVKSCKTRGGRCWRSNYVWSDPWCVELLTSLDSNSQENTHRYQQWIPYYIPPSFIPLVGWMLNSLLNSGSYAKNCSVIVILSQVLVPQNGRTIFSTTLSY